MFYTKNIFLQACYNSKELHVVTEEERTQLQAHLRGMYLTIQAICDRHNLRMCTGYGSVLGAIRHHGFIPWDDDMDLLMPREDYDRFINCFADELPYNLKVFAPNSRTKAIYRFAKVVDTNTRFVLPGASVDEAQGVFIDIFPLEYAPSCVFLLRIRNLYTRLLLLMSSSASQFQQHSLLYKQLLCSSPAGKRLFYFRSIIGWLCSWRSIQSWYNRVDQFCNYKKHTDYVNIPSDGGIASSLIPYTIDTFFPAKKVIFDDIEVYVPREAEDYLVNNYGDWKKIPDESQRWQHFVKEFHL